MKISNPWRSKAGSSSPTTETTEPEPHGTARIVTEAALVSKVITALLVTCMICGPLGLLVGLSSSGASSAPTSKTPRENPLEQARAGDFAVRVVIAWASATSDDDSALTALVPATATTFPSRKPTTITDPRVAAITHRGHTWTVTVAGAVSGQQRYFRVPVTVAGDEVAALTLPMPVAGPEVAPGASPAYGSALSPSSPLAKSVSEFLTAYLVGSGDISRYVAPGLEISAVTPPLGTAVKVDDLRAAAATELDPEVTPAEGAKVRVLVQATVTLAAEQTLPTTYALTVTGRAGRWEISSLDQTPAVRAATEAPGSTPAPTSTTPTPAPTTPEEE